MGKTMDIVEKIIKKLEQEFNLEIKNVTVRHDKHTFYELTVKDNNKRQGYIFFNNEAFDDEVVYDHTTFDLYLVLYPEKAC